MIGSGFPKDYFKIHEFTFNLIPPSRKRIDETTDWLLMVDTETKELYGGYFDHDTGLIKEYRRLEGQ